MKIFLFISLQLSVLLNCAHAGDIFDPKVFNWKFYYFNNPDLMNYYGNNATEQTAKNHWQNSGVYEGRQAASSFHTSQYLKNYSDISNVYGSTNYYQALQHYLNSGVAEGRIGHSYTDNGATNLNMDQFQRVTASNKTPGQYANWNNPLYVGVSKKFAGTIDSIYWQGKEFINSHDHGRQASYAWQYGSYPLVEGSKLFFYGSFIECFNPTEPGADIDGTGYATSSALISTNLNNNSIETVSVPSYWEPLSSPYASQKCASFTNWPPYGNTNSQDVLIKNVTVSPSGVSQLIKSRAQIYPENPLANNNRKNLPTRYEVPAIYANSEFNVFYKSDAALNSLTLIPHAMEPLCTNTNNMWAAAQGCEVAEPVIASNGLTGSQGYAIGAIVIPTTGYNKIRYQFYFRDNLNGLREIAQTRFIGPVVYTADGRADSDFTSYIAVGKTPTEVLAKLKYARDARP